MISGNGTDITEYQVAHGYSATSYSAALATFIAVATPTFDAKTNRTKEQLLSQLGLDYIHRFQPADQAKNLGGENVEKDPLGSLVQTARKSWTEINHAGVSLSEAYTSMSDLSRKALVQTSSATLLDGYVPHDTAVLDRGRVELESRLTTEQAHKTSENGYSRTQKTTLQNDRQSWESAESVLDRNAETAYQDAEQAHSTSENAYLRTHRGTLQTDQFVWAAAESLLDRNLDLSLQNDEQSHRTTENGYARTQKTTIQNDRQSWEAAESLLDRNAAVTIQDNDQAHRTSEAAYARSAKSTLQSDQLSWEAGEGVLERAFAVTLQDDEQAHRSTQNGYVRSQKSSIQEDRQSWESSESGLDRSAETSLQNAAQAAKANTTSDARTAEAARNLKQLNADFSTRDFGWRGFVGEIVESTDSSVWNTQPYSAWHFMWTPLRKSLGCGFLDVLYYTWFYRGINYIYQTDWTDKNG